MHIMLHCITRSPFAIMMELPVFNHMGIFGATIATDRSNHF